MTAAAWRRRAGGRVDGMGNRVVAMVLGAAALCAGRAGGATLRVPSAAYPTIGSAIDAAQDGDEVLVADGIYTGPGNRDLDFAGRLITVRSENGPGNCIIDCAADWSNPHRGFHFHSGETAAAVVDGFTITRM